MPMPSRPSTRRPGPRTPPAITSFYLKGRALHLDGKYDEAIAVFDQFGKKFPAQPLGPPGTLRQGRLAGPQGRLPQRRADLSGRGRIPALDRPQAADRRHLPGVCRHLLQAAQGRTEARLRQGPGVLQEGPGSRGQAGAADRDRAAHRRVPAEHRQAGRGGGPVREVHQGLSLACLGPAAGRYRFTAHLADPAKEPLEYRGPLPARPVPPGRRQPPRGPAGVAGPAGQVRRFAVASSGRRPVRSGADLEHPQSAATTSN